MLWVRGVLVSSKGVSRRKKQVDGVRELEPQISELSRHLVRAQEEERKRISRELHDEAGQGLMVLRLFLSGLLPESPNHELRGKIQQSLLMLDHTIGDLRRIIARLSPRILEEMGLLAAIRKEVRELSKNTGVETELRLPREVDGFGKEIEIAIYRSVQESLHNITKHSQARQCRLQLEIKNRQVRLSIEDNGVGFSRPGNPSGRTFGLVGMRERIAALGGKVRIRSRQGQGTQVRVILPLAHSYTNADRAPVGRDRKHRHKQAMCA
jgi:signal transduction histidine kinase